VPHARKAPMTHAGLTRWLQAPPATGRLALLCMTVAAAIPTIIRAAIDDVVTGCEFTPYLPFVLLSALLLRWWQASAVALASVAILGGLFVGPPISLLSSECFISSAGIFLASSAMMIGAVILVRRVFAALQNRGADESAGGIVFSLEKDQVWASWYESGPPIRLGSQKKVGEMMKDFLAQGELAKRLTRKSD
jgi:hypothetical protein